MFPFVTEMDGGRTRYCWSRPQEEKHRGVGPARRKGERALYATKEFEPGDVAVSKGPVGWVFYGPKDEGFIEPRCGFCGCRNEELELCSKCGNSYFCKGCPRKHYCDARFSPTLRLTALLCQENFDLETAVEPREPNDQEKIAAMAVTRALGRQGPVEKIMRKLKHYGHAITDDELRVIGIGLWPTEMTAANHSCEPNVWPRYSFAEHKRPTLSYVALTKIAPGAELCHEYCDSALPPHIRRRQLRDDYGFLCACSRCFGSKETKLHRDFHRARNAADDAIDARDFQSAAKALSAASTGIDTLYVGHHPHKSLHYLKLAKLQIAVNHEPLDILENLKLAISRLPITHGSDSPLLRIANDLRQDTVSFVWSNEYAEDNDWRY